MKVKTFQHSYLVALEDLINDWIARTKPLIHQILQSQSSIESNLYEANNTKIIVTISIFYVDSPIQKEIKK